MDFPRFVAMLEYGGLHFTPVEQMDDNFEGSLSKPSARQAEQLLEALRRQAIDPQTDDILPTLRRWVSISSWHMNEHESAAMWKLYSASQQAICIQTSYRKLKQALAGTKPEVVLSQVRYISYEDEGLPFDHVFGPFIHKRRSFEHEHELRAVTGDLKQAFSGGEPTDGVWIHTNLEALIDTVYIAPDAERWYVELVDRVARRYGLPIPVKQSKLAEEPVY
jgi:hypothetical protein